MSLRRRLLFTLGLSFCVLWVLAAAWLYGDLRSQMRKTLDQRLAASARMVAGLVAQLPAGVWNQAGQPVMSIPQSIGVACQISSPQGRVLLRTHGDFAGRLDAPVPGFSDRVIDGQRWRLFTYVQNGLHITTADRLAERTTLQRNVIIAGAVPFLVALLGSLAVLWFGIRRGLWPLERLRDELAHRDPDTLAPVEIAGAPAELAPAIATLNQLLARTRDALMREQRFTSDAAHELRTPLTAIKTHVQLATRLPADQAHDALANAQAGIARLQRTLEQLLLLARVEAGESGGQADFAASGRIIEIGLADLANRDRVRVNAGDAGALVDVPAELAAAALRNLLQNALRHSPASSPVELDVRATNAYVTFTISDRGDWPAEESTERLTQRFLRRDRAHVDAKGSGLGLAIVAAITNRFHGTLVFEARPGGGLVARLALPRAGAGI
ncbi:MAG: ATP-binding protein [Rhodanobacteraceae bacterium]